MFRSKLRDRIVVCRYFGLRRALQEAGQFYFGSENFSGAIESFGETTLAANR
jgi:hypothetical protein